MKTNNSIILKRILLCVVCVCIIISFSVYPVFADTTTLYTNSVDKYTFTEIYTWFMESVAGWGTVFNSNNLEMRLVDGFYHFGYYLSETSTPIGVLRQILAAGAGYDFDSFTWNDFENERGFILLWNPQVSKLFLQKDGVTYFTHVYAGNGNTIQNGGGSSGPSRTNNYYTDRSNQTTNNYDYGNTIEQQIIDQSSGNFTNISDGTIINAGDGDIVYSPTEKTWYAFDNINEVYYTVENNYTYNTVNYYMPGSDVPLSTWNHYYELQDGRNSATLTAQDVQGMNFDFDVVPYEQYATDPYQQALFHFDGDIENSSAYSPISEQFYSFDISSLSFNDASSSYVLDNNTISLTSSGYVRFYKYLSPGIYYVTCSIDTGTFRFVENGSHDFINVSSSFSNSSVTVSTAGYYYFVFSTHQSNSAIFSLSVSSDISLGYGASDGSPVSGTNPTKFEWTSNAVYQFVDTGTDFGAAMYIDGQLGHNALVTVPENTFTQGLDWTIQYRWYQEQSTSSVESYIDIANYGRSKIIWDGQKIKTVIWGGVSYSLNKTIPYGTWNTITLVRNSSYLLVFLNGIQIGSYTNGNISGSSGFLYDQIYLSFGADSNVHYFDELVVFSDLALYTANFVPRLTPWDSNLAYVVPSDVTGNVVAIQSQYTLGKFQLGGVRPSLPSTGDVYCTVEDNQITSIQLYIGYQWVPTYGAIYYNGHWFNFDGFNIHTLADDVDAPFVIPSTNDPGGNSSGNDRSFWFLIYDLIKPVINLLVSLVTSLASLLSSFFSALLSLLRSIISGIGSIFDFLTPIGDFFTATWSAFPEDLLGIITGGFVAVVLFAVLGMFL